MVAHAYAASHADHTRSVMFGECPLPGSTPYESGFKNSPSMWHFTFQQQLDLPELLTQGKEKIYIKHFYDRLCFNPAGIGPRDVEHYGSSFCQPGAMRAGFDLYRAFPQDAKDNQAMLKRDGKSKVPSAALSGEMSLLREVAMDQTNEFYEQAAEVIVTRSGHWTAEENASSFVEGVVSFIKKHDQ
jgi:pimeloyl-ACP methyl ester carboxylesterase